MLERRFSTSQTVTKLRVYPHNTNGYGIKNKSIDVKTIYNLKYVYISSCWFGTFFWVVILPTAIGFYLSCFWPCRAPCPDLTTLRMPRLGGGACQHYYSQRLGRGLQQDSHDIMLNIQFTHIMFYPGKTPVMQHSILNTIVSTGFLGTSALEK